MGRVFSRQEIISRLDATMADNHPIIAVNASVGISAKCAGLSGADLIIYSTMGRSRLMGLPTRIIGDFAAERSMSIHKELWQVVKDTPLICGLDANDTDSLDHDLLLDRFMAAGISGVCNLPTVQMYCDTFRIRATRTHHGFNEEVDLLRRAHERGLYTVGFVYYSEDALAMIDAGANMIVATCGPTQGGMSGYGRIEEIDAINRISKVVKAVKERDSRIICLGHGGPFNNPESTRILYDRTGCDGYFGGSSIERIPIENAVKDVIERYKAPIISNLFREAHS